MFARKTKEVKGEGLDMDNKRLEEYRKKLNAISDENTLTAIQEVKQLEKKHYAQQSRLNVVLVLTNIVSLLGIAAMIVMKFL